MHATRLAFRAVAAAVFFLLLSGAAVAHPSQASADLKIEKSASADPVTAGGLLTYTLNVTNNGPNGAENVVVTDSLPAGVQFVSTNAPCEVLADGTAICYIGALAAGAAAEPIMITVQVAADLEGSITNTASVSSSTPDNNPDNNTADTTTQVDPPLPVESADLSVTKVASAAQIMPGDTFDYILTVSNAGPQTAQNVVLFDQLPQGLSLVSASPGCGSGPIVRCDFSSLDVGANITVVLTVQAAANVAGTLTNTASVAAQNTDDPDPSDNMDGTDVEVVDPPSITPLELFPLDTSLPSGVVGQPFSVIFSGDGGQAPLTLSGASAPPGLGFFDLGAAGTGVELELRGVPMQEGSFVVPVTLTDSDSPTSTIVRNYTLTIGTALDIRPLSLPVAQVGANFITTFMTSNGIPPESFTSIDPLPPGFELRDNSLTGVPTQVGDFDFTIGATDAVGNQGTRAYTLRVLPGGLVVVTDILPAGVVNAGYSAQVRAIGGVQPYSWRVDSAVPEGITFSNTGFFNGRPRVAGMFNVTVTVRDQAGMETSADLPLTVNRTGLVNLTPTQLPNGLLGFAYDVPILPGGGTPGYQCQLADGQLPPGLSITGCATTISGTPTAAGIFDFTIEVHDSSNPPITTTLTRRIQIVEQPPIPIGAPPLLDPANTVEVPLPPSANGSPGGGLPDEELQQIAVDAFGNHYVAASTYNGSNYDVRLVKLDAMDNVVFERRFDSGGDDFGLTVAVSPLDQSVYVGGYVARGAPRANGRGAAPSEMSEALLLKYDIAGVLLWQRRNANGSTANKFHDLAADYGGVYAGGERFGARSADALVAKYGHDGALLWESVRATAVDEVVKRVAVAACAADRHVTCDLIVGGTLGNAGPRGWLTRLDPATGAMGLFRMLPLHPVEGLALAGDDIVVGGADASRRWRITRLDRAFQQMWTTRYRSGQDLRALAVDYEGFIYAVGSGNGSGDDGIMIILDGAGALVDELRFDRGMDDRFRDVVIGPSGQLTVGAESSSAGRTLLLVLKLDNGKAF